MGLADMGPSECTTWGRNLELNARQVGFMGKHSQRVGEASGQNIGGQEGHGVSVVQGRLSRFSHGGKGEVARIVTDL
jgi:hypothetical protein